MTVPQDPPAQLSAYLPKLLQQRLTHSHLQIPHRDRHHAVLLFADISGFTNLTETLNRKGPAGLETLTELLNGTFDIAITHINQEGGDILKFAGDALLALWPISSVRDINYSSDSSDSASVKAPTECISATQQALHQAATAAFQIQAHLTEYTRRQNVSIALRIAITLGKIDISYLGGHHNRCTFSLSGAPLNDLKEAITIAQPQQILITPQAWASLDPYASATLLDGETAQLTALAPLPSTFHQIFQPPHTRPQSLHPSLAQLTPYIPSAVLTRLEAGQRNWLAEFRQVTAVFVHLQDCPEATANGTKPLPLEQQQAITLAIQTEVDRYEGHCQFQSDDKGSTALIVMGMPPFAHDNDACRAVLAARAIQAALASLQCNTSIGIASGKVFCGSVGSRLRREYTTIGGAINLAARLMQVAGTVQHSESTEAESTDFEHVESHYPKILCDQATAQAAITINFRTIATVSIRGRSSPISIHTPITELPVDPTPSKRSRTIGRQSERSRLLDVLKQLENNGTGQVIWLEGEAGIGKSQLLQELEANAASPSRSTGETTPIRILRGQGDSIEKQVPYRPWQPIIASILNREPSPADSNLLLGSQSCVAGSEPIRRFSSELNLYRELNRRSLNTQFAPLLAPVLGIEIPEPEAIQMMSGSVRADNTRQLLLNILQNQSQSQPTLIILDDAQWLDSASWQLVHTIVDRLPNIALILSTRPFTTKNPDIKAIRTSPRVSVINLEFLDRTATRKLLCQCLETRSISDHLLDSLYAKTQGQPFFTEQLAYSLQERNRLRHTPSGIDLERSSTDVSQLELPNTLQGTIISRIDRLQPNCQLLLKTASAIGRTFPVRMAEEIYPLPTSHTAITESLDTLTQQRLTLPQAVDPQVIYRFKHVITQEVAYNLMMFSQRRALHEAAAHWLERQYQENSEPQSTHLPLLAYHWLRAENFPLAQSYAAKAGALALRNGAYTEATELLSQAIAVEPKVRQATAFQLGQWHRQLGVAQVGVGQLAAGREALVTGIMHLGSPLPKRSWQISLANSWQLLKQLGQRVGLKERSPQTPKHRECLSELALACTTLGELYYYSNDRARATHATLLGLNTAERAGPSPELARIYANMCFAMGVNNLHWLAKTYARLALSTCETHPQLSASAWVNTVVGAYRSSIGDWGSARELSQQAISQCQELGDRHRWTQCLASLAAVEHWQGRYQGALELWRQTLALGEEFGNTQAQVWGLLGQVEELIRMGEYEQGEPLVEKAQIVLEGRQDLVCEVFRLQAMMAEMRLFRGDRFQARKMAVQGLDTLAGGQAVALYLMEAHSSTTHVLLELWSGSPNSRSLMLETVRACEASQAHANAFPVSRPRAAIQWGWAHQLQGRTRLAQRCWRKGDRWARRLQMPYELSLLERLKR